MQLAQIGQCIYSHHKNLLTRHLNSSTHSPDKYFCIPTMCWALFSLWGIAVNKTKVLPTKCLCSKGKTIKKYTGKPVYAIP